MPYKTKAAIAKASVRMVPLIQPAVVPALTLDYVVYPQTKTLMMGDNPEINNPNLN